MLHHSWDASCRLAPSQSAPLSDGLGLVHVLLWVCTPPPQLREHSLGADQAEKPPLTAKKKVHFSWMENPATQQHKTKMARTFRAQTYRCSYLETCWINNLLSGHLLRTDHHNFHVRGIFPRRTHPSCLQFWRNQCPAVLTLSTPPVGKKSTLNKAALCRLHWSFILTNPVVQSQFHPSQCVHTPV